MSTPVELSMTAGLPYSRRIRVADAAKIWPTRESFEVRSQIRTNRTVNSVLVAELTPYLTAYHDGDDIVVDLVLTGENTRQISKGYYDIIISDVGDTDARALSILSGKVRLAPTVTAAADG